MEIGIAATSLGGGFFGGIVIGYALKKVAKMLAIVFGLFQSFFSFWRPKLLYSYICHISFQNTRMTPDVYLELIFSCSRISYRTNSKRV
jgi:hypothetical protein